MRLRLVLVLTVAVVQPARAQTPHAAGTYAVLFCRSTCGSADSGQALAKGLLVLDSSELRGRAWGRTINGCFEFRRSRQLRSYAVLSPRGYTSWSNTGDTVRFITYLSPDAGHEVVALASDTGFVGTGHSWGVGAAAIHEPDEFVIGARIGPADRERCPIVHIDRRNSWLAPLLFGIATATAALLVIR
jgi:hypothetical protein